MRIGALLGLGSLVGLLLSAGCAAGSGATSDGGSAGSGAAPQGGSGGAGQGGSQGGGAAGPGGSGQGGFEGCAKFTEEATQAPAAMLVALDMSASMSKQNKWGSAQLALVGAVDKDVFDTMSLGLVTFPSSFVDPPQCLCDKICEPLGGCDIATCKQFLQLSGGEAGVSCGVSALPQVAVAPAGKEKSNAGTGVRSQIYQYLTTHQPLSNIDDGSPVYDAMVAGYNALKFQNIDRRILVVVTDGGFSCTSVTSRQGYADANGCPDWEYPSAVNDLITQARNDPAKPVFTFVVGVPGSDTTGSDPSSEAPYHMRLALSTYAVSGSPDTVDPACSKDATFSQSPPPANFVPCHIDLSGGAAFNPDTLASAIQTIRGKALGCVYDLPPPPAGETIDLDYVNVEVTIDGASAVIPKRKDPSDACKSDGCWDYNVGNQVQLLGKTCDDLSKAQQGKVNISVGCQTIVK